MKGKRKMDDKSAFYQSKFEYYKKYAMWVVICSSLASLTYFVSDCQLFGRFAFETLFPRFFILLPLGLFLIISRKIKSYKILVPMMYTLLHIIMWDTIWAIYYLPIKQHANEGFIIMHLMFLSLAFCAPLRTSTIWHSLLIVDIIVSNFFNHYENFDLMLTLGIPCLIAICVSNKVMDNAYLDQYRTKHELVNLITKDHLTNAFNREKFDEICYKNTDKLIVNEGTEVYILILDIDFFKKVNDTFGHDVGDEVLKHIVTVVQSCVRQRDYVIRWGGEEFVVVLMGTDENGAARVAERIRATVEESTHFEPKVTVSIGACRYDGNNYHTAITNADYALYQAKRTGRNKIVLYENEQQL